MSCEQAEVIVDRLVAMGFLKFVAEADRDEVRRQLIESAQRGIPRGQVTEFETVSGNEALVTSDKRSFPTDAENLAFGSMGDYLRSMQAVLPLEGVLLENAKSSSIKTGIDDENWIGKQYRVTVNKHTYLLLDTSGARPDLDTWGLAHKRFVEILNELLEKAGPRQQHPPIAGHLKA